MNDQRFDRSEEDAGNVVRLEHVNLRVPDQIVATQFYVSALGLTRDPYLMTGADNMWINAGHTQFHLPLGVAQRFRGTIGLVIPGRRALLDRLLLAGAALKQTEFTFNAGQDFVDVRCPWGNRLRCFEPEANRFAGTTLGIVELEFDVPPGCAEGVARFYGDVLAARATISEGTPGLAAARIQVGKGQSLVFTESAREPASYDGHHIQVYVADFSGPHRRLQQLGGITEESDQHQFRFLDIVDTRTGAPLFRLEHEIRSMTHPLFARPLVNRNPEQSNRNYRPGRDAFVP
jgi:catechol 2,3-dioxygenase-like lactoylglutathione lyase family enzyme